VVDVETVSGTGDTAEEPIPPLPGWPPPRPDRAGIDLGPHVAILFAAAAWALDMALSWWLNGPWRHYSGWSFEVSTSSVVNQVLLPGAITLVICLLVVAAFGWWTVCGLGPAFHVEPLRWSALPLAVVVIPSILVCARFEVAEKGLGLLALVVTSLLVSALVEEVVFRGFLLRALSRSRGGAYGVIVSSLLFALAHVPGWFGQVSVWMLFVMGAVTFGFGVLACRIRVATGSVWFVAVLHALENFTTYSHRWFAPGAFDVYVFLKFSGVVVGLMLAAHLLPPGLRGRASLQSKLKASRPSLSDEGIARAHALIRGERDPDSEVN
jgi:membrane protease YdiL (CAAX protease family)